MLRSCIFVIYINISRFKPNPNKALRINRYEFFILFYSGLIKGVVAYALICEKPEGN